MAIPRTLAVLLLTLTFAAAAFAQEDLTTAEFGRSSGGELAIGVKQPTRLSGSIGIAFPLRRNGATLGGTLVKDRLWFFASAEKMDVPRFSNAASGLSTNMNGQLGDRQSFDAALRAGRDVVIPQASTPALAIPSSFLSLRYTGIVSSNSFFSASFSRTSSQRAATLFAAPQ